MTEKQKWKSTGDTRGNGWTHTGKNSTQLNSYRWLWSFSSSTTVKSDNSQRSSVFSRSIFCWHWYLLWGFTSDGRHVNLSSLSAPPYQLRWSELVTTESLCCVCVKLDSVCVGFSLLIDASSAHSRWQPYSGWREVTPYWQVRHPGDSTARVHTPHHTHYTMLSTPRNIQGMQTPSYQRI